MTETVGIALLYASGIAGVLITIGLAGALIDVLKAVAAHRDAQAQSVLRHAGLLDMEGDA
jgi:hypothetical protein